MVKMLTVVVVIVAVLLITLVTWAVRRRGVDEVHSVDGYRHTLETLQDIRSRSGSGSVRVLGRPTGTTASPSSSGEGADPTAPPVPAPFDAATPNAIVAPTTPPGAGRSPGNRRGRGSEELVFDDTAIGDVVGPLHTGADQRGQDQAISAMGHRPRRLGVAVTAIVVVALLAVVIVVGIHFDHSSHQTVASKAASAAGSHPAGVKKHSKKASAPTTTTTTVPPTFTAVTYTATTATYTLPSTSYAVTFVTKTGACWITVTSATGSVLFTQTLQPGQSKSISTTGKSTIILGAPSSVTITIDHEPVVLPGGYQTPFYMTLLPAS